MSSDQRVIDWCPGPHAGLIRQPVAVVKNKAVECRRPHSMGNLVGQHWAAMAYINEPEGVFHPGFPDGDEAPRSPSRAPSPQERRARSAIALSSATLCASASASSDEVGRSTHRGMARYGVRRAPFPRRCAVEATGGRGSSTLGRYEIAAGQPRELRHSTAFVAAAAGSARTISATDLLSEPEPTPYTDPAATAATASASKSSRASGADACA